MDGGIERPRADAETQLPTVEVDCTACNQLRPEEPEQALLPFLLFLPDRLQLNVNCPPPEWYERHLQVVNVARSFHGWCASVIHPG